MTAGPFAFRHLQPGRSHKPSDLLLLLLLFNKHLQDVGLTLPGWDVDMTEAWLQLWCTFGRDKPDLWTGIWHPEFHQDKKGKSIVVRRGGECMGWGSGAQGKQPHRGGVQGSAGSKSRARRGAGTVTVRLKTPENPLTFCFLYPDLHPQRQPGRQAKRVRWHFCG